MLIAQTFTKVTYYAFFDTVKQFIANKHYTFWLKTGLIVSNNDSESIVHVFSYNNKISV